MALIKAFTIPRLRTLKFYIPCIFIIYIFYTSRDVYSDHKYVNYEIADDLELPMNISCEPNVIKHDFDLWKRQAARQIHPSCVAGHFVSLARDGTVRFAQGVTQCRYSTVKWSGNDFKHAQSRYVSIQDGEKLDVNEEFFHIRCKRNRRKIEGNFARIFKRKMGFTKPDKQPMNVFMLGLDSVSRKKWLSGLPRSSEYLIKELGANVLNGYNIVGDGTPAALIPILTGKHEEELPNTLKGVKNSVKVDEAYPFVWKDLAKKLNYATLYNEDWPHVGCFHYRMNGFGKQPTTHYTRPFQASRSSQDICDRGVSTFDLNLEYSEDFMSLYREYGFFAMNHIKIYTHNHGLNDVRWLDDSFLNFFKRFKETGLDESTILVIFSDHGQRYEQDRKKVQGLLEERNPFFSIYLPKLFQQHYPREFRNLKMNVDKLVAPMDIHATLMDLIDLQTENSNRFKRNQPTNTERGLSLFGKISAARTCDDAGIDSYWCGCLKRTLIQVTPEMNGLARSFVTYLNEALLKDHMDVCHSLELDTVNSVYLVDHHIDPKKIQKWVFKSKKEANLKLAQPPALEKNFKKYLFQVQTKPNNGIYEFNMVVESVIKNGNTLNAQLIKAAKLDKKLISRINKYGNDEHCIHDKFPDLRKYCYCYANHTLV